SVHTPEGNCRLPPVFTVHDPVHGVPHPEPVRIIIVAPATVTAPVLLKVGSTKLLPVPVTFFNVPVLLKMSLFCDWKMLPSLLKSQVPALFTTAAATSVSTAFCVWLTVCPTGLFSVRACNVGLPP